MLVLEPFKEVLIDLKRLFYIFDMLRDKKYLPLLKKSNNGWIKFQANALNLPASHCRSKHFLNPTIFFSFFLKILQQKLFIGMMSMDWSDPYFEDYCQYA